MKHDFLIAVDRFWAIRFPEEREEESVRAKKQQTSNERIEFGRVNKL